MRGLGPRGAARGVSWLRMVSVGDDEGEIINDVVSARSPRKTRLPASHMPPIESAAILPPPPRLPPPLPSPPVLTTNTTLSLSPLPTARCSPHPQRVSVITPNAVHGWFTHVIRPHSRSRRRPWGLAYRHT